MDWEDGAAQARARSSAPSLLLVSMDSITQAVLGAAVGEAALGRRAGNRALVWGAIAGTLPDLDILAYPFLDAVGELRFHRGPTHALLFAFVAAPVLGWLVGRIHRDVGWRGWAWLFFWGLVTHPLLDTLTVYGTQLFRPFSDYPAAVPAVFIIDPLYTLPLLAGVLVAWRRAVGSPGRRRAVWAGLGLSTLYLVWALGVKVHVDGVVRENLRAQGIEAARFLTNPTPLNTILWTATVDVDDGFLVGHYGLLDADRRIRFRFVPQRAERVDALRDTRAVQALLWFSRGYYVVTEDSAGLVVNDIRFGRADGWLSPSDSVPYVFPFRLLREDGEVTFRMEPPSFDTRLRGRLIDRVLGRETRTD